MTKCEMESWIRQTLGKLTGIQMEDKTDMLNLVDTVQLYYLYYEIWRTFGVYLSQEDIEKGVFRSTGSLANRLLEKVFTRT